MNPPDYFALLGLDRRASLTTDEIRSAFQSAAAASHPDQSTGEQDRCERTAHFALLNTAQTELTSVPRRLKHLRTLLAPDFIEESRSGAAMTGDMLSLFSLAGTTVHAAAAVRAKKQQATTFLARAMLAGEEMIAQEKLATATADVERHWARMEIALVEIDSLIAKKQDAVAALQAAAHLAAFLERWQNQLRNAFASFFDG